MYKCTSKRAGSLFGELLLELFTKLATLHEAVASEPAMHAAVLESAAVCAAAAGR